jgi:DNA-binding response OmpR family regulator
MKPIVLITATNDAVRRDVCDVLYRFDYEAVVASDETEALALLRDNRQIGIIVADVELGGLTLAREARTIRPHLGVVYTATTPHRVADSTKVSGAPILRKPYAAQQLVGVIRGLGRRVLDEAVAA